MPTLESKLEKKLVDWAKAQGGIALKGATSFDTGYPDRIVYVPGAHAHAEIKGTSTRYHLNEKQKVWAGRIIAAKTPYFIIENETQLEKFKEEIYIKFAIESVGWYSLNGFQLLMKVHETTSTYEVVSFKDGIERRLISAFMSSSLSDTIYDIFVTLEERFPNTNYCDM